MSYLVTCVKPRLHERFFACDGDAIFLKIVASPARAENRMCSHPRTGDATVEKIAEKNREKFNELNFLRLNHGLRQRVATETGDFRRALATRQFQKNRITIASKKSLV